VENITARSIDSLSEKISRKWFRIATVGLILFIIRIPALRQGRRSRSGRFSERAIYRHNGTLILGFPPPQDETGVRPSVRRRTPVCFATSPGEEQFANVTLHGCDNSFHSEGWRSSGNQSFSARMIRMRSNLNNVTVDRVESSILLGSRIPENSSNRFPLI
jgi:hypothetical protein